MNDATDDRPIGFRLSKEAEAGFAAIRKQLQDQVKPFPVEALKPIDLVEPDFGDPDEWAPNRTAAAAEQTAEATGRLADMTSAVVDLTEKNLQLAQAAQDGAARTERFTRRMAWASLIVAGASLLASIAAIIISTVGTGA